MTTIVEFLHPFSGRLVRRVLCPHHQATARAMLEQVQPIDASFRVCQWCEAIGSRRDSKLRDIVERECHGTQLEEAIA